MTRSKIIGKKIGENYNVCMRGNSPIYLSWWVGKVLLPAPHTYHYSYVRRHFQQSTGTTFAQLNICHLTNNEQRT